MIYIVWSAPSHEEAKTILISLLDQRLIACGSILGSCESWYRWEGKVEHSLESKVLFKTEAEQFKAIADYIAANGSYKVPEVVSIRVEDVYPPYLSWLSSCILKNKISST